MFLHPPLPLTVSGPDSSSQVVGEGQEAGAAGREERPEAGPVGVGGCCLGASRRPRARMPSPDAKTLKSFVLTNVNNRLGHDVHEKVMPEVEKLGGCEGITRSLEASLTQGIKPEEVASRQEQYGKNYIEPDPPTPFWQFCLNALEDFTMQLLLFFAAIGTVSLWAACAMRCAALRRGLSSLKSAPCTCAAGCAASCVWLVRDVLLNLRAARV